MANDDKGQNPLPTPQPTAQATQPAQQPKKDADPKATAEIRRIKLSHDGQAVRPERDK